MNRQIFDFGKLVTQILSVQKMDRDLEIPRRAKFQISHSYGILRAANFAATISLVLQPLFRLNKELEKFSLLSCCIFPLPAQ